MMFVFLPIMIFVVAISLPIALSLYWFYGNVFTIVQSYFLYRDSRTNTELKPKGGTAK
jgi:YidC/Oxa1 family membrane protein insertase